LPAFKDLRLDQITTELVDRYRLAKVREGKLGPRSINRTISTLAAILEDAVECEIIARNPARGRRRRLPAPPPQRSWIDRAEHVEALLAAAGQLDQNARVQRGQRRAVLATMVFAGLRISETLALRWRDVDLARGTIAVNVSKTDAGRRTVYLLGALRDELGSSPRAAAACPGGVRVRHQNRHRGEREQRPPAGACRRPYRRERAARGDRGGSVAGAADATFAQAHVPHRHRGRRP
jgi:integrase